MPPEDLVRLGHIIAEAGEACVFAEGITLEEFIGDRKTAKAIIRSVEVIGEAASRMSDQFREKHPEIPWQQIIGMRNRLIHGYFDIDYPTVWHTVKDDLPPLLDNLKALQEGAES
jgi:uncharacterized protein with HEPN domain